MLHRILVPLDGTAGGEQALPLAEYLARETDSALLLARIAPITQWNAAGPGREVWPEIYDNAVATEEEQARAYLNHLALAITNRGLRVETYVRTGEPTEDLLALDAQTDVDLIVMASHMRSGAARLALGSLADHLVRYGKAPVMIVRNSGASHDPIHLDHGVVPLDGSSIAAGALEMVIQLAGVVIHRVTLVRAVDPTAPSSEAEDARRYLEAIREQLLERVGRQDFVVESRLLYGDAAHQILGYTHNEGDLIVMATHGRTGLQRWALGSVAERIVHTATIPLILVRPQQLQ
ncbi:MAG TPA: universal stress protein [Ktedonobacterales bacterium]|nr:universal stress protein [Ktedonobacterales bacterium]